LTLWFRARTDALEFVKAGQAQGFTFAGKELLAVVYKLRALDCGRELPGIEPSSVIPLTVNNLEAKSAYRSRRFYPALMYDLDMRVALTPLSGPVPYAGVGVSAQ
jgi:hypothetical protein